jgi:hypothetical protein
MIKYFTHLMKKNICSFNLYVIFLMERWKAKKKNYNQKIWMASEFIF